MTWLRRKRSTPKPAVDESGPGSFVLPEGPAELDRLAVQLRAEGYADGKTVILTGPESLDWLGVQLANRGYGPEAEAAFRSSAAFGYPTGAYNYALTCVLAGRSTEAREYYRVAAEGGHASAANRLGAMFLDVDGDPERALGWFERALTAGDPDAEHNVAVTREYIAARATAAATRREDLDPGVAYRMGVLAERARDDEQAERWFQQAASAGHTEAALSAGMAADRRRDEPGAMPWYRLAADAGSTEAMFNLALCCVGQGDPAQAEHWYREAAEAGHAKAMTNLGTLLMERGDHSQSKTWFERAYAAGDGMARRALQEYFPSASDSPTEGSW